MALSIKDRYFIKKLAIVSIPMIAQNVITSCLNLVDTFMLGRLGEENIAAAGCANQMFFLFTLTVIGLLGGTTVFIPQFWGKRDSDSINKTIGFCGCLCMSVAFIVFLLVQIFPSQILGVFSESEEVVLLGTDYLRIVSFTYLLFPASMCLSSGLKGTGRPLIPMKISALCVFINIVLNYIFIFGKFGFPFMGIKGAALATLVARAVELFLIAKNVFSPDSPLVLKFSKMFSFSREFAKKILKVSLPVTFNESLWAFATVIYNFCYARLGTDSFAAYQAAVNIMDIFLMMIVGFGNAGAVIIGHKIGQKLIKVAKNYANRFVFICVIWGAAVALIMFAFAPFFTIIFSVKPETVELITQTLKSMSLVVLFKAFNTVTILGILRSGGDTKYAFYSEMFCMWAIGVPAAIICGVFLRLPLYLMVIFVGLEEFTKTFFIIPRLVSKKWVHNLTQ